MATSQDCISCVFAKVEDNKQTGCSLNRLDRFNKVKSLDTESMTEYYYLDRNCLTKRGQPWAELHKDKDLKEQVYSEIKVQADIILIDDSNLPLKEKCYRLENALAKCVRQVLLPKNIIYCTNENITNLSKVSKFISERLQNTQIGHFVSFGIKNNSKRELNDLASRRCVSVFSLILEIDKEIPQYLLHTLDVAINKKMKRFVLVRPIEDIHGLVVMKNMFKVLDGNRGGDIENKIEMLAKDQNNHEFITTWEELNGLS